MRILYYSPHPYLNLASPAGAGTHMREMIKAFREKGHEVSVCILGGEHLYGDLNFHYSSAGWKGKVKRLIPDLLWQSLKDFRLISKDKEAADLLRQCIEEYQPDLVYERGFYLMDSGLELAKGMGLPHILEMNAPFIEEKIELEGKSLLTRKAFRIESAQIKATDRITVVSSALQEFYSKRHPQAAGKIMVTPNAIDPASFVEEPERAKQLRQQLGIEQHELVVGFVGSILPYHGVEALVKAFAELQASDTARSAKLLIVGDGESLPEIRRNSELAGLKDRVIFTGNVRPQEVRHYIANMDITVLANSGWYNSPIKIFEYGAMGKCIVSIASGPVLDVMQDRVHGILFSDTATGLLPALKMAIEDEELRNRVASCFRDKVLNEHTWLAMASKVLQGFEH